MQRNKDVLKLAGREIMTANALHYDVFILFLIKKSNKIKNYQRVTLTLGRLKSENMFSIFSHNIF